METSDRGATCLSARRGRFLRAERTRHLAAASVVAAEEKESWVGTVGKHILVDIMP